MLSPDQGTGGLGRDMPIAGAGQQSGFFSRFDSALHTGATSVAPQLFGGVGPGGPGSQQGLWQPLVEGAIGCCSHISGAMQQKR